MDLLGVADQKDFDQCLRSYNAAFGEHVLFSDFVWKVSVVWMIVWYS